MSENNFYTAREDIANAVTHGIGAALAIAGTVILIVYSAMYKNSWYIVSFSIYGTTLMILYLSSTLYHSFKNQKVKKLFRIFDHSSIYLLIAGTYTPFTLTILKGPMGWTLFGVIWLLAVLGIIMKVFWVGKYEKLSTLIYILMGWLIVIAMRKIFMYMAVPGIILLFLGGVIYTAGCIFYLKDGMSYNHAVWHLFVLAGSVCHYFSILLYL